MARATVINADRDGQPLRAVGTQADISSRKKAEKERGRLIMELTKAITEVGVFLKNDTLQAYCQ